MAKKVSGCLASRGPFSPCKHSSYGKSVVAVTTVVGFSQRGQIQLRHGVVIQLFRQLCIACPG